MNQICDGYNPKVLMGNWHQESYAVEQDYRTNPQKYLRQADIDISYIDAHLKLRPLNRISRMPQWNTKGLTQTPQYKVDTKSAMKEGFELRTNEHYFNSYKPQLYNKQNRETKVSSTNVNVNNYKKQFRMFNESNINELLNERKTNISSFKSQLKPAEHVNNAGLLKTTYQMNYSDQHSQKNTETVCKNIHACTTAQLIMPALRRIRSDITLKNIPLIKTQK